MAVTIWMRVGWPSRTPHKIVLENGKELSTVDEFLLVKDANNALIAVFPGANSHGAKVEN